MSRSYIFSSESVGEGHPDKVCDTISDAILDANLAQDKKARVACETLVSTGMAVIAGEITSTANVNYADVAREKIKKIGYKDSTDKLKAWIYPKSKPVSTGVDDFVHLI